MDVTSMQSSTPMTKLLLKSYKSLVPDIRLSPGKTFYWSPKTNEVFYDESRFLTDEGQWALLHELAHAQLGHTIYDNDAALLALEVEAWEKALRTAETLGIQIDPDHIQDCLDTYRDWLYARSTCPTCKLNSLQTEPTTYMCLNCRTVWSVSRSRFCRPYRMQAKHKNTA